jgi:hypothetical protein
MHLFRTQTHALLEEKGISNLYHANTVLTACQFLKAGALLSRGNLERRKYRQTPQSSDPIDKKYNIWFDVFTDFVDIHHRGGMLNIYGPVLFVIDTSILSKSSTGRVWITKKNPTKWSGLTDQKRWFQSIGEATDGMVYGDFDQMLVFRHCGGELPFEGFVTKIILDDPEFPLGGGIDVYSMAYGALLLAMEEGGQEVAIEKRRCRIGCSCKTSYRISKTKIMRMFSPTGK